MAVSSAIRVVSVDVQKIGEQQMLKVAVDVDDAKLRKEQGGGSGLETVKVWGSHQGEVPVDQWSQATFKSRRKVVDHEAAAGDGASQKKFIDRHELVAPLPAGVDPKSVQVAAVAVTEKGQANAQEPHQNASVGHRLYGPDRERDANGRFKEVDGATKVKDVATLKARAKGLVEQNGDLTVAELRAMFGGKSITKIAHMRAAERAAVLALHAGSQSPADRPVDGVSIGVATGTAAGVAPSAGAPI